MSQHTPSSFRGAASGEPGIHIHRLWLWIPGPRLTARPGMTTGEGNGYTGLPAYGIEAVSPPSTGNAWPLT
jgi:hypothetical protein